ncbi:glycosyltransferase [Kordia zhangzhouensis]|uniref:glycosyltransferase n=1 Tax=Kordia zhangzhouensis TaxID=1620405 RepID=UPI00069AA563|nr:glycosyltransferase [Kordia zhangzhouensis]
MKIGILIVFRNNEKDIDVQQFTDILANKTRLEICFVNNGSTDGTLKKLHEIKEEVPIQIATIDVKKDRGHNAAIKAGVRYLTSKKEFPYILCLQKFHRKDIKLLTNVFHIIEEKKGIVVSIFNKTKRIVHKNVFSLRGILERAC